MTKILTQSTNLDSAFSDRAPRNRRWHIRSASIRDASVVAGLGARAFYETYSRSNAPSDMDRYTCEHFTPSRIRAEMNESGSRFYLGEDAWGCGGYAKTRCLESPTCVGPGSLEQQRLYVLRHHHNSGLGGLLLRTILRASIRAGWLGMWLGVDQDNANAISFYRRFGFEIVGTKSFALGSSVHPDYVMARSLEYATSTDDLEGVNAELGADRPSAVSF